MGGDAVNLGSSEAVGFVIGVGKMGSIFKVLSHLRRTSRGRIFQEVWQERERRAT